MYYTVYTKSVDPQVYIADSRGYVFTELLYMFLKETRRGFGGGRMSRLCKHELVSQCDVIYHVTHYILFSLE